MLDVKVTFFSQYSDKIYEYFVTEQRSEFCFSKFERSEYGTRCYCRGVSFWAFFSPCRQQNKNNIFSASNGDGQASGGGGSLSRRPAGFEKAEKGF